MLEYFELSKLFENVEAKVCAAECHGFLCGQVCVSSYPLEELWQEFIDVQVNNDAQIHDCYQEIRLLLADIVDNIQYPDMDFQLMLPDEDSSMVDRTNALAEWCHGFLNGYGVGAGQLESPLKEDCQEVLEDFTKICRIGIDEDIDEEDEQAMMELIEYVRMGTIMIYEDISSASISKDETELMH